MRLPTLVGTCLNQDGQAKLPCDQGVAAPRRQAALIFQATPQVTVDRFSIGANVVGTTSSYAQDVGDLRLPGFTQVNGFAQWHCTDRLLLSLNANNLFDVRGFTEAEDGTIPANGIVRARSINGRTTSLSLRVGL